MRLLLFGSGVFGVRTFEALHAGHEVVALVGPPDRPAGRKRVPTPAPAVAWAEMAGVEVWRSEAVNDPGFVTRVDSAAIEASVVIAFGQKLGPELLEAMGGLSVNLHGSLLPAWRGAAPVQRSVMAGDRRTGVSVIGLAQRMDAGPIFGQVSLDVQARETAGEVHDRLAALGPAAVSEVLDRFIAGTLVGQPQDETRVTKAAKLAKTEGTVSFAAPAAAVAARINGLNPWPGCRVRVVKPEGAAGGMLLLRRAEPLAASSIRPPGVHGEPGEVPGDPTVVFCAGSTAVRLLEVQLPGRGIVSAEAQARGGGLVPGSRLTPAES